MRLGDPILLGRPMVRQSLGKEAVAALLLGSVTIALMLAALYAESSDPFGRQMLIWDAKHALW